ncbi:hypothetical protein [Vibrio maerlii]|uniref:hypothetical protein n=1 Tax=Vibrio maerlii TaxID=2231648 RepID=UPI000E3B6573|nr:hypothetical protein [Vibrio maerlii]
MHSQRQTYYNLIHHGIQELLMDRLGHYSENEYHQYLDMLSGKSSCFAMNLEELKTTLSMLESEGYLEDVKSLIPHH